MRTGNSIHEPPLLQLGAKEMGVAERRSQTSRGSVHPPGQRKRSTAGPGTLVPH